VAALLAVFVSTASPALADDEATLATGAKAGFPVVAAADGAGQSLGGDGVGLIRWRDARAVRHIGGRSGTLDRSRLPPLLRRLEYLLSRLRAMAALGQAFPGTARTAPAIAGNAEFAAEIVQRTGATAGGFTNLAIGDGLADADVHP
jgi:hypothetical protein